MSGSSRSLSSAASKPRPSSAGVAAAALLSFAGALTLGCRYEVTRISNGTSHLERPIPAQAYAAFGRARWFERAGDSTRAIAAYREVLSYDGGADEAYVRIGALSCTKDPDGARQAFEAAETRNPHSAALYQAKARCALYHRRFDEATTAALRAMSFAPNDPEASHLLVDVHVSAGRTEEALRCAWAHVAVFANDTSGWQRLADLVGSKSPLAAEIQRRGKERISPALAYSVMQLSATPSGAPKRVDMSAVAKLDLQEALTAGNVRRIHRAARQLRLSTMDLMDRAFELGAFEFARAQARLAGAIEPENVHVWVVRLKLADLLQDDDEFSQLLQQAPSIGTDPSKLDWQDLVEIVERRTGVRCDAAEQR